MREGDGVDGCDEVDGDGADLGGGGGVADASEDGGLESRDGVCVFGGAEVHEEGGPDFPVAEVGEDAGGGEGVGGGRGGEVEAGEEEGFVWGGEEGAVFGEGDDEGGGEEADEDGDEAFDDEDPDLGLGNMMM